ncbi:MAG: acyl-CoA dehydrogenase [Acidimicrobiia bacterium]|nr:acyl-CoA dehydrogenase [Acidimicrobiia bacterium]
MDFSLTDEQVMLRDTARALLAKECPPILVREHVDDPTVALPLWSQLKDFAALGDGPCTDLCLFIEETGYAAAPGPFFATTALFAPLLAAIDHELLPAVLAGDATGTVAVAGADGQWTPNDEPVKTFVPEADRVDFVAIVGADARVRVVPSADVSTRHVRMIDFSRRFFEVDTAAVAGAPAAELDPATLTNLTARATAALAAEMVGTSRRLFEMALAYAKERIQFDVPIGSFQAIQHRLAECSLDVERATAAAQYAAMTLDAEDPERFHAVHVAKAAAGNAATRSAKDSIQIHGGIGYTWEHDLHLYLRRAVGSEYWLGTTSWHHDRLADLLMPI